MNRIDIYIDPKNNNNIWGMITYTEKVKHIPRKRQEIVYFGNAQTQINYVKQYFQPGEVFYHTVSYDCIECLFYKNHPELDRIDIKYFEYKDGKVISKKINLPPEFEAMFIDIIKANKGISRYNNLDSRYYRNVDVYQRDVDNRKETIRSIKMSVEEFFQVVGKKIKRIDGKKIVKGLKIIVPMATLAVILSNGVNLVANHSFNSRFMNQKNSAINTKDIGIYIDKGKAGEIIEKLIEDKYDEVSDDDIDYVVSFIKKVDEGNYDNNSSYTTYNYADFFGDIAYKKGMNSPVASDVLKKIESLYNNSIAVIDGKTFVRQDKAKEYLDYVCSLAFMYDTYHTERPKTYVPIVNKSIMSPYASYEEIKAYDKFPEIVKNIILNQARGLLRRTTYEVKPTPTYYFGGTDKPSLLIALDKRIESNVNKLYSDCSLKEEKRTI